MRGAMVLLAYVLIGVGVIVAWSTRTVDGWLMLSVVGLMVLGWELHRESVKS